MSDSFSPESARDGAQLTLRAFLELPSVRGSAPEVIVGTARLDSDIGWVRESAIEDPASSADAGELLLSGRTFTLTQVDLLRAFVTDLAERDAFGLCLLLGENDMVPASVTEAATARGIAIVALRRAANVGRISREAQSRILRNSAARSDALLRDETRLLDAAATGDLGEVLTALAERLDNPVALMSPSGLLLTAANPPRLPRDPFEHWPESPGADSVRAEVPSGDRATAHSLLTIPLGAPLPDHAASLVERAARLVGLLGAIVPVRGRDARLRFDSLKGIRAGDPASRLVPRLRRAGFRPVREGVTPFVIRNHRDAFLEVEEWYDVAASIQELWGGRGPLIVAHTDDSSAHGLISIGDARDREALKSLAGIVANVFESIELLTPHLVVGEPVSVDRLHDELLAVTQAAEVVAGRAERVLSGDWVDARSVELPRFLRTMRGSDDSRRFIERTLYPLTPSSPASDNLLPTLEIYCQTLGRKAEAARRLHLNRQTLYARLERIEELLRVDLDDTDTIFMLGLALRLRRS